MSSRPEFLAGLCAAWADVLILYPVVKITFRQQLHGIKARSAFNDVLSEGLRYLYRGVFPPLIQRSITRSIMFGAYDVYKFQLTGSHLQVRGSFTPRHALAGFLAGCTEAVMCPLERVQTLLQSRRYHDQFRNTGHALRILLRGPYGLKEYYRGGTAVLVRNGLSSCIFFSLRDPLTQSMPQTAVPYLAEFASGALLGALLSTLFYPMNVVKSRMQSTVDTEFLSVYRTFRKIWAERNQTLTLLFRGVHLNYTRSFFSWGVTNAAFEFFLSVIREKLS